MSRVKDFKIVLKVHVLWCYHNCKVKRERNEASLYANIVDYNEILRVDARHWRGILITEPRHNCKPKIGQAITPNNSS